MIFRLIAIFILASMTAFAAPKADPDKPLYQFKWGYPPPFNMTIFGAMEEVTVDAELADTQGDKSADTWQSLAKWSAIAALVLTGLWYFSSKRELGGAAGVSLLCSLGCTVMAEIVTRAWMIAVGVVAIVFVLLIGYLIRDKSVYEWIKGKISSRKKQPPKPS